MSKSLLVVILSVAILSTFMTGVQVAVAFDPERLRVLDRHDTSVLVRGNAPINRHGDFDPGMVIQQVKRNFHKGNSTLGRLFVISLISPSQSDEKHVLRKQRSYFVDKNMGHKLYHRPIVGSWISPPPSENSNFPNRLNWYIWRPDDGAWDLVQELKDLLHQSPNTILYVHCMRGVDRTGLVAGAYLARWSSREKMSEEEIHRLNHDVAKREINWPTRNALRWILWKAQLVSSG